ncbi:hypothetical protein GCM10027280_62070 [Micromonospora polyrhachis]|uniref:Flavin reductase n=1 Tax=Micromonospora polyrhachis TaxID=1282883 RepID=A0A7W7SSJ2_9ACTN|nr:hypothetical protein [Micromonospora polyrhachis]MBB4960175.1 hypothetical protein [Micromonospora polyrhachis]
MSWHNPLRPYWTCTGCDADWPCPTKRRELFAEYQGAMISLSIYLASQLVEAAPELDYIPAGWLHNRFLGWIRHPAEPLPHSATDVLVSTYDLVTEHTIDHQGCCPTCGDPDTCWVRINPAGPAIAVPLPRSTSTTHRADGAPATS